MRSPRLGLYWGFLEVCLRGAACVASLASLRSPWEMSPTVRVAAESACQAVSASTPPPAPPLFKFVVAIVGGAGVRVPRRQPECHCLRRSWHS
jgi:hypothetical protein